MSSNSANGTLHAINILDVGWKKAQPMPDSRVDENVSVEVGDDSESKS